MSSGPSVHMTAADLLSRKEAEMAATKMKLDMAEDYVDKLRTSLRDTEDKLQDARRANFTVLIGSYLSLTSCL